MTSLAAFLQAAGFRQVSLRRNGVGHFEVMATLNDQPVSVLIDTGAASTVVSLALARELGLKLQPLGRRGGGAGGADLEIFEVRGGDLRLGRVIPRTRGLFAMDLTHVNAALVQKGATPVDLILGVDVFDAQAAIIDYGSASLFLRDVQARDPGRSPSGTSHEPSGSIQRRRAGWLTGA